MIDGAAAMADGTGLAKFAKEYPNRFYDVGIAEQHATTFAAGLAKNGMKPYFAVYDIFSSSFPLSRNFL